MITLNKRSLSQKSIRTMAASASKKAQTSKAISKKPAALVQQAIKPTAKPTAKTTAKPTVKAAGKTASKTASKTAAKSLLKPVAINKDKPATTTQKKMITKVVSKKSIRLEIISSTRATIKTPLVRVSKMNTRDTYASYL